MNYTQQFKSCDALMQEEDEGEITKKRMACVRNRVSLYFNSVVISEDKRISVIILFIQWCIKKLPRTSPNWREVNLAIHLREVYQILNQLHFAHIASLLRIDMALFLVAERILQPLDKISNGLTDLLNNFHCLY